MNIDVGDHVRDREYFFSGRVVSLYGRWAWIVPDNSPPNATPLTSQVADLILDAKAEAA